MSEITYMYARQALMTAVRPESAAAALWSLVGTLVDAVWPPVMLSAELGFRGWPSASAGPTVMSGASGDGGSLLGRPPPFEPQVYGENIAVDGAGREINGVLAVATDERDKRNDAQE